jgi:LysM repeat protein
MMLKTLSQARWLALIVVLVVALAVPATAYADQVHVVQRGENLTRIALRYGTTVTAIAQANGIRNPSYIYAGQRLRIPTGGGGGSYTGGTSSGGGTHVVQRGENLSQIALRYGTTVTAIAQANGIRNTSLIYVGQRLTIPGGGYTAPASSRGGGTTSSAGGGVHVVQRGETLSSIAYRYGTSVSALVAANGIRNPSLIYVGQRLRIPSGSSGGGYTAPSTTTGGAKWIDIDLSSQTVRAYQGNTLIRSMITSTGIARYPTPPGRFRVYSKYPSVTMSGPGYYLPGVPHTMFFYRGYAIHGTYWHNNFGTPMSHGCVNLTRSDAAWLYSWTPIGTSVVIHW